MQDEKNNELQSSPIASAQRGFEAIILAGGLGTRLRSVVADVPKCMAEVAGKPFLYYVLTYLQKQGVTKFIFSLGYLNEVIEQYLETEFPNLTYTISLEKEPLGTGGAIFLACKKASENNVFIVNGDTLFMVNFKQLHQLHQSNNTDCTLALKPLKNFERYGVVEIDSHSKVISFQEKKFYSEGLINGGCYLLNVKKFITTNFQEIFSFEKDYLEKYILTNNFLGQIQDEYFIDIGIPEDFKKAQQELLQYK